MRQPERKVRRLQPKSAFRLQKELRMLHNRVTSKPPPQGTYRCRRSRVTETSPGS